MDSRNRRSRLNLPPGMSPSSLHLETTAGSPGLSRVNSSPSTPSPSRTTTYSDRFIPSRTGSRLNGFALIDKQPQPLPSPTRSAAEGRDDASSSSASAYSTLLRNELFGEDVVGPATPATPEKSTGLYGGSRDSIKSPMSPSRNLFRFKNDHGGNSPGSPYSASTVGSEGLFSYNVGTPPKPARKITRSPYKVLDAPALQDDFYLNLVDWSSNNVLAVGLGTCVYLWSACTSKVTKLCDLGVNDSVCSVGWTPQGTHLAVGTNIGEVQIWDASRCKKVRTMGGHCTRAGALAWSSYILSSGSRDRNILHRDIRVQDDFIRKLVGHKSEVCGLKWSYDDRELASGGNDNQLLVWNQQSAQPLLRFNEHTAAVKAIAWSPHQHGILASGGGTADRCLRFWNTATDTRLNCVDTGSQVCNLVWCKNVNELVSTHGYSQNQIMVWRYPSMSKLATLTGHTLRVLYLAISPDGQTIVTGAGDETLRFWSIFPSPKSQSAVHDSGLWSLGRTHIR